VPSDTVKYLFYEYERHLRQKTGGDTSLHTLVRFSEFKDNCEVEHIAPLNPETPEAELKNHAENKNRLANLAILWPEDNKGASNDKYTDKYTNTYKDSGVKLLETLPDPSKGWNIDQINVREEEIIEFCLERWCGETKAWVFLDKDLTDEVKSDVRERVDSHYKHTLGGAVPTINLQNGTPLDSDEENIENVRKCPACNGVRMEEEENGVYYCSCGNELDGPSYQISNATSI
jgi:hypothetical protein